MSPVFCDVWFSLLLAGGRDMPTTAVFVRRSDVDSSPAACAEVNGAQAGDEEEGAGATNAAEGQVSKTGFP